MSAKALSVTALTKYIKYKFDQDIHLKDILLEGEISNFKHNVRGHFYFTLKDKTAQISAVMFKGNAFKVKFKPEEGMNVIVRGYVSVFEVSGSYQIYVERMDEVGMGNLYQAYLQLKARLEEEGLFDKTKKKVLPKYPKQIAVLTSKTGAAVRDMIHIINRRYPLTKILIYRTTVQGENAKHEIVKNNELADKNPDNEVIIVGRGGGSIEDLWAFNEEIVARAIDQAQCPIVSAVGHETDFTIADFVADMRAPTPSGAAEIVVPDQVVLHREVESYKSRLYDAKKRLLVQKLKALETYSSRYIFKDPERLLMPHSKRFEYVFDKLRILHPSHRLKQSREALTNIQKSLHKAYNQRLKDKRDQFANQLEHLDYVNPLNIMKKGYTITKKANRILKSSADVAVNDTLTIQFHDGTVETRVLKKEKDDA